MKDKNVWLDFFAGRPSSAADALSGVLSAVAAYNLAKTGSFMVSFPLWRERDDWTGSFHLRVFGQERLAGTLTQRAEVHRLLADGSLTRFSRLGDGKGRVWPQWDEFCSDGAAGTRRLPVSGHTFLDLAGGFGMDAKEGTLGVNRSDAGDGGLSRAPGAMGLGCPVPFFKR